MTSLDKVVCRHFNLALEKTGNLPKVVKNSITNEDIDLKDYQYLISRIFIGLDQLNSLLLFWDTGYGKTLTAVYIIKYIQTIFPNWFFIIFIKTSLYVDPWLNTLKKLDIKDANMRFVMYDSTSSLKKFNVIYRNIINSINKKTRILIIIDEVHHVISKTVEKSDVQRNFKENFRKIALLANTENNKLLCMSATPITNNAIEFKYLLQLLRPKIINFKEEYIVNNTLLNFKQLNNALLSICSYKKISEADSFTNTLYSEGFAGKNIIFHDITMTEEQSKLYNLADMYDKQSKLGGLKTLKRLVSSFAYYNIKIKGNMTQIQYNKMISERLNEFKALTASFKFSKSFIENFKNNNNLSNENVNELNMFLKLKQYSCKYIEACKLILNSDGKVLLYEPLVSFEGITTLKIYLTMFSISYIEYSSKTEAIRTYSATLFNEYDNNEGNKIKLCIFSSAGSEGISFTSITDIIILELPWKESDIKQIIGRSIRLNSHINMPRERRYVNVHFIFATTTNGKSVDHEIFNLMKEKQEKIKVIYNLLNSVSIETIYNKYPFIEPIEAEYIFNTLRHTKIDEDNITNVLTKIIVSPIYYCFESDKNTILEGYLNKKNNLVYNNNVPIATIIYNNGDPKFFINNEKLIYVVKPYISS